MVDTHMFHCRTNNTCSFFRASYFGYKLQFAFMQTKYLLILRHHFVMHQFIMTSDYTGVPISSEHYSVQYSNTLHHLVSYGNTSLLCILYSHYGIIVPW